MDKYSHTAFFNKTKQRCGLLNALIFLTYPIPYDYCISSLVNVFMTNTTVTYLSVYMHITFHKIYEHFIYGDIYYINKSFCKNVLKIRHLCGGCEIYFFVALSYYYQHIFIVHNQQKNMDIKIHTYKILHVHLHISHFAW